MDKQQILNLILDEIIRQDEKWGKDRILNNLEWLSILAEEFGEVSKEVVELNTNLNTSNKNDNLKNELIQVAAVCIQFYNSISLSEQKNNKNFNF